MVELKAPYKSKHVLNECRYQRFLLMHSILMNVGIAAMEVSLKALVTCLANVRRGFCAYPTAALISDIWTINPGLCLNLRANLAASYNEAAKRVLPDKGQG